MSLPILYLIKLSISLSIIWLFYHLLLRRLTFYNMNRWYLLGYSVLSFLIPLINIDWILGQDPQAQPVMIKYIPVIGPYTLVAAPTGFFASVHPGDVFLLLASIGSCYLIIRFLIRWQALRKIRRHATLIRDTDLRIYQVDQAITPFSFGSAIYINGYQHTDEEWSAIIQHERVHVRQRHTIDILLAEFICMINWYNPFTWLIRHAIRQNLEFIADNRVVDSGCDKKSYQYHLLKVAGQSRYCLANNFNFSSLKKRIIMMNKVKSARFQLVKFLFIVPFLAVLLIAFRTVSAPAPAARPGTAAPSVPVLKESFVIGKTSAAMRDTVIVTAADLYKPSRTWVDTLPKKDTAVPEMLRLKGPARPLFIVDGKELPLDFNYNSLNPNDIRAINILKGQEAKAIYGEKGVNGVVLVTTKNAPADLAAPGTTVPGQPSVPTFRPDIPVPGKNIPAPTVSAPPAPVPGAPAPSVSITPKPGATVPGQPPVVTFRPDTDTLQVPLYVVDGVEKPKLDLGKILPSDIESIDVHKDDATTKKYGEKGKNGVLLIKMKKTAAQK